MLETSSGDRHWIPDLVADCWRTLNQKGLWRTAFAGNPPGDASLLGDEGARWRLLAQSGSGWAPSRLVDEIEAIRSMADRDRRATQLLRMLVALDRAGDGVGFRQPGSNAAVGAILQRWRKHGKLSRPSARTVVLRKAASGFAGGASLDHYLHNYTVYESDTHNVHVHPLLDHLSFQGLRRGDLKIAFVPILGHPDDALFEAGRGENSFVVVLDPNKQRALQERVEELVFRLDDAGVNVAILPESCVTEQIATAFGEALSKNLARPREALPALRLTILGVGAAQRPDHDRQTYNDVRILGADGRQVCCQTKLNPWHLDDGQRERYGIGERKNLVREDINLESPATLHAVEDEVFGRMVVLICEDLTRADPSQQLVAHLGPSLVVGPVMDDSLERGSWAFQAAQRLATGEPHAIVLVSNSCWLPRLSGTRGRRFRDRTGDKPAPEPAIGIVHHHRNMRLVRPEGQGRNFHIATIDLESTLTSRKTL